MKTVVNLEVFRMRLLKIIVTLVLLFIISGCSDKLGEFKKAALEIDTVADKAAKAISLDAHEIREIELDYKNETFTINDIFKTILRDAQWEYDKEDKVQRLIVRGKWQEPLFESYLTSDIQQSELAESGKITIKIEILDGQINPESTSINMIFNGNTIVEENGEEAYYYLLDTYTSL